MTFKEAASEIELQLNRDSDLWNDAMANTDPGNYGTEDIEFSADFIKVNFQEHTYQFENASLSFHARLGCSGEDHVPWDGDFKVSGSGTFEFVGPAGSKKIQVVSVAINERLDLYSGAPD